MATDYAKRLQIPLEGNDTTKFYSLNGQIIAEGYVRIVIGGRGPYIEFEPWMIYRNSIRMPEEEEYRLNDPNVYYLEYRSIDISNVKVYAQLKPVDYADYLPGKCYISPFDLKTKNGIIIEKWRKL